MTTRTCFYDSVTAYPPAQCKHTPSEAVFYTSAPGLYSGADQYSIPGASLETVNIFFSLHLSSFSTCNVFIYVFIYTNELT